MFLHHNREHHRRKHKSLLICSSFGSHCVGAGWTQRFDNGTLERESIVMKSTKLVLVGAASLLGVALAAGGAYAATGSISDTASLSNLSAPGQLLKTTGVGPASTHASATAKSHANANAKGIFGSADTSTTSGSSTSTPTVAPVAPSIASKSASTVKGNLTGKEISAWAHQHATTEVSTPEGETSAQLNTDVNVHAQR